MNTRQLLASGLMAALVTASVPISLSAQQTASINGTARKEAKKPFSDFTVQLRNPMTGMVVSSIVLDKDANWTFTGLQLGTYLVELVKTQDRNKIICTEGPFNLSQQTVKNNVNISCNSPLAWWLLAGAGAAGLTAGIITNSTSPSQ